MWCEVDASVISYVTSSTEAGFREDDETRLVLMLSVMTVLMQCCVSGWQWY